MAAERAIETVEQETTRQAAAAPRRVLMISYDFPPSLEMGAQACAQIARYLPRYGWEPVVLTVHESHIDRLYLQPQQPGPEGIIRTGVVPHPIAIYRGLKARFRLLPARASTRESRQQLRTIRRWILSLLFIPDEFTGWVLPATVAGLRLRRRQQIHHLFSSGPRWSNHLVGLILAQLTGLPWTAHFRDPWSQEQGWKPVTALSTRIDRGLEKLVLRQATSVICVTQNHTALLRQAHPELAPGKFATIPNGFDGAEWDALMSGRNGAGPLKQDKFVIAYAGSFYCKRTPLPLFRALKASVESGHVVKNQIRIDLVGWCDEAEGRRVTDMAADCGLSDCVRLTGPLSRADTHHLLLQSNLLLLLAEELTHQIPGKTYEYLRARRPILALTSEGALAQLLRRTGGAWVVNPADPQGITAAVSEAYGRWREGLAGPLPDPAAVAAFDRRLLTGRFAKVFDRTASAHRPC